MTSVIGKTVLITGGASGIGLLMGQRILEKKAKLLIIWDVNRGALDEVTGRFKQQGFNVASFVVDVSDQTGISETFTQMKELHGTVDILINNAGIVIGKDFSEHSHADIDRTFAINVLALMHVTKLLLEDMLKQKSGHVVNIASAAGMVSNPRMSVYCGSKWAVIGWSDSLRLELEKSKSGVRVTTVTPYYINTGMFSGVRSKVIPILNPEPVARKIIRAVESNRIFLRLPWILNLYPFIRGLLPVRVFDRIFGDWLGIYESMDRFRGRE